VAYLTHKEVKRLIASLHSDVGIGDQLFTPYLCVVFIITLFFVETEWISLRKNPSWCCSWERNAFIDRCRWRSILGYFDFPNDFHHLYISLMPNFSSESGKLWVADSCRQSMKRIEWYPENKMFIDFFRVCWMLNTTLLISLKFFTPTINKSFKVVKGVLMDSSYGGYYLWMM